MRFIVKTVIMTHFKHIVTAQKCSGPGGPGGEDCVLNNFHTRQIIQKQLNVRKTLHRGIVAS